MIEEKLFKAVSVPGVVKDVDTKKGIVKGYFAVFGNVDSDNDIIEPGAFAKSIKERGPDGTKRIKHLKYHDTRLVPGVPTQLGEDEFGGWFVSQLAKNEAGEFTTLAKDTLIEYEAGVITEHSHGFNVLQKEIDESGIRHIIESRLWEFSSLGAWGANSLTRTEYVKNLKSEEDVIEYMSNLTERLKIGAFSDDYLERLEKEYAELSSVYNSLTSKNEPRYVTCKNGHKFDYNSIPESGMGWVKCPTCKEACTQGKGAEPRIEMIGKLLS